MAQGRNANREGARSNELYQLQTLNRIKDAITGVGNPPAPAGIATEATLQAVLTAVDSMRDYEVRLVTDSIEVTWLEVRYWDAQTGALAAPEYYLPGSSTPGTPTGAITYVPTSTLLSEIKAELIAVNAELDAIKIDTAAIDVNTDGLEGLLTTIDAVLDTIKTDSAAIAADFSTETTLALVKTVLDTIKVDSAAMVVDLAAIEALLITIDTDTGNIATSAAAIDTKLAPAVRTLVTLNVIGSGSIPAGSLRGSIMNIGNEEGRFNGTDIPAGVSIPWGDIANRDTYGQMAYDTSIPGTGTTFLIEYTI